MGMIGARFGRNVPSTAPARSPAAATRTEPAARQPRAADARDVHAGDDVNVLAGAWLQFEVHDWFSHGKNVPEEPFELELADDDPWSDRPCRSRARAAIPRRTRTRRRRPTSPPTRTGGTDRRSTAATPGSQTSCARTRTASCVSTPTAAAARSRAALDLAGVAGNFWLGLGAPPHAVHARAQRDLRSPARGVPAWSDDELFERARLVNAALMAKIHTVEWTPAIIAHPTTVAARCAPTGRAPRRERLPRRSAAHGEMISGIPGSPTDHHGVPYSITEEFVAVYRMHPLMPDQLTPIGHDQRPSAPCFVPRHGAFKRGGGRCLRGPSDALDSFGTRIQGRLCCTTFRAYCRTSDLRRATLSTSLRWTSCAFASGVCRATTTFAIFHQAAAPFEDLRDNPAGPPSWGGCTDVDRVDLMVGLYAEPLPRVRLQRHGVSRLHPDGVAPAEERPLLHDRLHAAGYTRVGLDWIADKTPFERSGAARRAPAPALSRVNNAFAPWPRTGATA